MSPGGKQRSGCNWDDNNQDTGAGVIIGVVDSGISPETSAPLDVNALASSAHATISCAQYMGFLSRSRISYWRGRKVQFVSKFAFTIG